MRVLHVVGALAPEHCGVAHYTSRLAEELNRLGLEVGVATGASTGDRASFPIVRVRGFPESPRGLVNLLGAARRWRADLLHLQYAPSSFDRRRLVTLLPIVARMAPAGPKIATTLHEYGGWPIAVPRLLRPLTDCFFDVGERAGWLDREALSLVSASDLIVATNPDHVANLRDRSKALAQRARVVPIGPNVGPELAPNREAARASLGLEPANVVACFFGFVHPVKGIETLLQSMQLLRRRQPSLKLWIVGGVESLALRGAEADAYERAVRSQIRELGLDGVVDLTGYVPDGEVACRLRAADFAVLPFNRGVTLKSGTLITALSFGLPTIATTGGTLGGMSHGQSIWLVPPRDAPALAGAMDQLASHPAWRRAIGEAAQRCSAPFTWSSIAKTHRELYESLPWTAIGECTSGTCFRQSPR